MSIFKITRTNQPQANIGYNSNLIINALLPSIGGAGLGVIANNIPATHYGEPIYKRLGRFGYYLYSNTIYGDLCSYPARYISQDSNWVYTTSFSVSATHTGNSVLYTGPNNEFEVLVNADGSITCTGGNAANVTAPGLVKPNMLNNMACVLCGGSYYTLRIFLNGMLVYTGNNHIYSHSFAIGPRGYGRNIHGSTQAEVYLSMATRYVGDDQAKSLSMNPWQIFNPIDINPQFDLYQAVNRIRPVIYTTPRASMMMGSSSASVSKNSSIVIKKTVMATQPQYNVAVDRSNPITRGVIILDCPSITDRGISVNNTKKSTGRLGQTWQLQSSALNYVIPENKPTSGSNFTFLSLFTRNAIKSGGLVSLGGGTPVQLLYLATNSISMFSGNGGGGEAVGAGALGTSVGDTYCVVGRTANTSYRDVWLNGNKLGSDLTTISGGTYTTAAIGAYISGGAPSSSFYPDISVYLTIVWARALTDYEIVTISNNPWQVFKPSTNLIGVPV